jgi:hypothetical protein
MPDYHLPIALYEQREQEARLTASYPALRTFSPVAFTQVNFPMRVANEAELRRYADIMYEVLSRDEWLNRRLYSQNEAQAICRLSAQIETLTGTLFAKPVQPLMCLFASFPLVRMVEHLAATAGRRLSVFEIGLGAGHLAAYLINAGHRVIAMDNCQSLYLWQNRLLGAVSGDLDEWALADVRVLPPRRDPPAFATHIPWWHFARFHELPSLPISVDVVICDAAMGEMDHFAFRYISRIASMLTVQSDIGCFMFQNLGEERIHQRAYVEQFLADRGFRLHKVGGVSVLIGSDRFPVRAIEGLAEPPPIGGPLGMSPPAQFLPLDGARWLESYAFFDFIGIGR